MADQTPIKITPEALKAALESPSERLKRMAPAYTPNNTYGRCSIDEKPPPQRYWENGPSQAEKDAQRKNMNTIGIWALGPIAGGPPALVRLLGGSEDAVESAAEIGMNITDIAGGGNKGAKPKRQAMKRTTPRGTFINKPKPKILKKNMTRAEIKEWMLKNGVDPSKVDSYMEGIDMSKPVNLVELQEGTALSRWGDPNKFAGGFASPGGMAGDNVGLDLAGKVQGTATLNSPISALESTAAPFGGSPGGGPQYQFGDGWQSIPWKF
jgi:hypothetical protein